MLVTLDFNTFPQCTFIILLEGRVYMKVGGGYVPINLGDNHDGLVGAAELTDETIPPGSRACILQRQYIKDKSNIWRLIDPSPTDFGVLGSENSPSVAPQTAATPGTGVVLTTLDAPLETDNVLVLDQAPQWNATAATEAVLNVPMIMAQHGLVENPADAAFTGEFATHAKASIVFGIAGMPGSNQRNMQYNGKPITREKLAKVISEELKKKMEEKGPLLYGGEVLAFERLFLIVVERNVLV